MRAKRTIVIEPKDLLEFLQEKFDITGHQVDLKVRTGNTEYDLELKQLTLEWTEGGRTFADPWSR